MPSCGSLLASIWLSIPFSGLLNRPNESFLPQRSYHRQLNLSVIYGGTTAGQGGNLGIRKNKKAI
jgi:hypothetical protein